jgi:hypothetical protein
VNLEGKSRSELVTLRLNAERILADPGQAKRHRAAREVLDQIALIPAPASRPGARVAVRIEAVDQLVLIAREVAELFDITPPPGTSQPHKLTAAKGQPKVGGRQRKSVVAVDRYISHRRGNEVASLGWLRRHDEDAATGGGWYAAYVDADTLPDLLPEQDVASARAAFIARLEEIGTPRRG